MKTYFFLRNILTAATLASVINAHAEEKFVVHEWGTFTSLQGNDGVPLAWSSREVEPLPEFVYDWKKPGFGRVTIIPYSVGGKTGAITMQWMETPFF